MNLKKYIKKSRLRWLGQAMRVGEERTPKKILHTKMEGNRPRGRHRTKLEMIETRGEMRKKYKKIGSGRIETPGDFSVIVDPYV